MLNIASSRNKHDEHSVSSDDLLKHNDETIQQDFSSTTSSSSKKQFKCLDHNFEIIQRNKQQSIQVIEDIKDCTEFPVIDSWKSFGLDRRIISAVFRQGFHEPTRVQQIAIPIALSGKDIVCSSSTGTGKTAAFLIPAIQMVLHERKMNQMAEDTQRVKNIAESLMFENSHHSGTNVLHKQHTTSVQQRGVRVLYLVPSQELCIQVHQQWKLLAQFCKDECNCIYFRSELNQLQQDIKDLCDLQHPILITTPESLAYALSNSSISLKETLKLLIIDEADQIIRKQMEQITMIVSKHLPGLFQCILMSATLKAQQAISLKEQLLKEPVVIQLDRRTQSLEGKLHQYYVDMKQMQAKLPNFKVNSILLLYYFLSHKFYGGRVIVYVPANKLFFVYFGLRAFGVNCVMLPYFYPTLAKIDIIKRFNTNEYQVLISTMEPESEVQEDDDNGKELYIPSRFSEMIAHLERRAKGLDKTKHSTTVSHLSRGIDYKRVASVIYFDLPKSCTEYIHGVGRTARAGNVGVSVMFVQPYADQSDWEKLKTEIESKYGIEDGLKPYPYIDYDIVFENEYRATLLVEHFSKPFTEKYKEAVEMEIANQMRLAMGKEVIHDMEPPFNVEFEEPNPGMVRQDPFLLQAGLLANITAKGDTIRSKSDIYTKGKSLRIKTSEEKTLINRKIQQDIKAKDPLFHFQKPFVDQTIERLENAAPVENFMNKLTNNTLGVDNIIKHQRDALINPKKTAEIKRSIASSHKQKVESLKRGIASADMLNPHRKKFKDGFYQKKSAESFEDNNFHEDNSYTHYDQNEEQSRYNRNHQGRGNYRNNKNNTYENEASYDNDDNYQNNSRNYYRRGYNSYDNNYENNEETNHTEESYYDNSSQNNYHNKKSYRKY
ncbi:hypothetical protein FDP41_003534 [Naegleria fowleri]|uniref:RNA helicase n=1 Tax=Naegleria fowleri TaxID=5763 RepID=A0A6A5BS76_NAEFO|nr:uncharacterized protein FDP41_003534 [Naegleria fowleri]KAF0977542.1 hypothetical protein FDP41_003534 [Naegleria fowleri]CAG4708459.1 unnamed protein product [Naegleria fowleri]